MFTWQRRPRFHLTITGEAWEIEMCYHGNKRREGQHPVAAVQGCTERKCDYWELWSFQRRGLDLEASIKKKTAQHHHFLELYDSLQKILINSPSVCGAELDFVPVGRPLDRYSELNVAVNVGVLNRLQLNLRSDQGCMCSFKSLKERRTHSQSLLSGLSALTTVRSCSFTLKHSSHRKALDLSFSFHPVFFFIFFHFLSSVVLPSPSTHTHLCIKDVSWRSQHCTELHNLWSLSFESKETFFCTFRRERDNSWIRCSVLVNSS